MDKIIREIDTFVLPFGAIKLKGRAPFQQYSKEAVDFRGILCHWVNRGELGQAVRFSCHAHNEVAYVTPYGYEKYTLDAPPVVPAAPKEEPPKAPPPKTSVPEAKRKPGRPRKGAA